jgi:hypothetical protein
VTEEGVCVRDSERGRGRRPARSRSHLVQIERRRQIARERERGRYSRKDGERE